ncbi:uncharacterized protein LOC126909943, partial [Daktulosphaira vitifoliae]
KNLEEAVFNIKKLSNDFPKFVKRFEIFYKRKTEWVKFYRLDILTRGNNTNNYAEASIRVLKEIVLCRTKAYNVTALVESVSKVWEEYYITRLLDHAHVRKDEIQRKYIELYKKMSNITLKDIQNLGNGLFIIPSSTKDDVKYTVNISIGVCNCFVGVVGAFCKHQAWLHKNYNLAFPNAPPVTSEERHLLGKLALGEKCPSSDWFCALKESKSISTNTDHPIPINDLKEKNSAPIEESSNLTDVPNLSDETDRNNTVSKNIKNEFNRLEDYLIHVPLEIREKFATKLKLIKNPQQLTSFIVNINKNLMLINKKRGQIKVQPTAISRRRQGLTRGSRKVSSGRPPVVGKCKIKKRIHNLNDNIKKNQMNATYHGRTS